MKRRGDALLARAAQRKDPEFLLQAHHCGWASHYHVGDFRQSSEHAEAGLAIYAGGDFRHHAHIFGNHDPKVCAHGELSLIHWMQGRPHTAMTHEQHGLCWASELGHLGSRVHAMDISLAHHVKRRDFEHVYHHAGEFIDFTSGHGLDDHRAKGQIFRGWTVAMRGDADDGLKMLEEGFAAQRDIGTSEDFPIYVCLLADALMSAGQPDRALEELIRARAKFNEIGLRMWLPEVLRTTAEAVLAADRNAIDAAVRLLDEATRVAEEQLVPMLALRTAISRARLASRLGDEAGALTGLTHAITAIEEPDGCEEVAVAAALAVDLSDRLGRARQPEAEVR
jgi:predicted ATPase